MWTGVRGFDLHFPNDMNALEKEMAVHSSVLAWRIPGMEEPGGLPSMGWQRVGHDWSDLAAAAAAMTNDVEYLFMYLLAVCTPFLVKYLFRSFDHVKHLIIVF